VTVLSIAAAGSIAAVLAVGAAGCTGNAETGDSAAVSAAVAGASDSSAMPRDDDTVPRASGPPRKPSKGMPIRPAPGPDTLRGVVRVVGADIDARPVLRPNGGGPQVALLGAHAATLSRLSGTDVWVSGKRNGTRGIDVGRFLVRSVSGVPAIDGTLIARDGGFAIMTTADHAEHPIVNPPAALRSHVGARVWITGPLETGAVTFGVISDR
jgi:hypothetical protein